jgi:hypothetical protein
MWGWRLHQTFDVVEKQSFVGNAFMSVKMNMFFCCCCPTGETRVMVLYCSSSNKIYKLLASEFPVPTSTSDTMSVYFTVERQAELNRFEAAIAALNQETSKNTKWASDVSQDPIFASMTADIRVVETYEANKIEINKIKEHITHCKNMIQIQGIEKKQMGA